MSKNARKSPKPVSLTESPVRPRLTAASRKSSAALQPQATSKQARVIEMLRSATGATIAWIMQDTGWQQHSVRGFLAGVVRKKLGLNLQSKKLDGERIYRIASGARAERQAAKQKRRV